MIVVSDSTPLMHFGKIDRLDLLQLGYDEIVITQAVYRETVTEGINMGGKERNTVKCIVCSFIHQPLPSDLFFLTQSYQPSPFL